MKKKILSLLLASVMALTAFPVFAANPSIAVKSDTEVINVIKLLGIANGDQYGNMNFDNYVTRAEFVKMAVCASSKKDDATENKLNVSLFPDVVNSYWGAGYIWVAINNGMINGYLDGTFRPDNNVTLEEAATIVLRLLGYTSDDFLSPYPQAQLAKYKSLDLDSNISAAQGQLLTRRQCMQLLYNALSAKSKAGTVYCTSLGYSTNSDGIIDYNALLEAKLKGPIIVNNSNYTSLIGFNAASATVYRDGKTSSAAAITNYDALYYISEISTIWTYTDKAFGIVDSVQPNTINPTAVTVSGKSYTLASDFSDTYALKDDAYVMLVLDRNGTVCGAYEATSQMYNAYHDPDSDYLDTISATVSDPFVVADVNTWKSNVPFEVNDSTNILLNGKGISPSQILINDVVYYSSAFSSLLVYRKTATGICTSVTTANNSPSTIALSGNNYTLATNDIKNKFAVGGAYSEEKCFVTLLLGMNDDAVGAIDGDLAKLSDNTDNPTYLDMVSETISLPILLSDRNDLTSWQSKIPFGISNAKIYVNGVETTSSSARYNDVIYYSEPFSTVWIFRNTKSGVIAAVNQGTITVGTSTYALATDDAKYKVSTYGPYSKDDYVTLVLGKDDEVVDIYNANTSQIGESDNDSSYSEVVSSTLKGPYLVAQDLSMQNLTFELSDATIYNGSTKINSSDIQSYDVYYFSELLNTIWIYRDTASGTIEEVSPVSSPTSVVLAGKAYQIESSQASYDLSSFGTFHVGDAATFLLGKDGMVAGVVPTSVSAGIVYGIVTDKGIKEFTESDGTKYSADYVSVTATNSTTYTYEFENKYLAVGDIVKVTFASTVKISKIPVTISNGNASVLKIAIRDGKFATNCEIIDVSGSNVKKIYPSRISGLDLNLDEFTFSKIVSYYQLDANNNIQKLILNNFTGDLHDYGVVSASTSGLTKYMTDSSVRSYTDSDSTYTEGPACFRVSSSAGTISGIQPLRAVVEVEDLTKTAVYDSNDKEYPLSDDVKVFIRNTASYTYSSLEDVMAGDYVYKAYYDKTVERGGKIRVIIASRTA